MTLTSTDGYEWSSSGGATLSSTTGNTVTLTAGQQAGSVTVTLDPPTGTTLCSQKSISFDVIEPTAVTYGNKGNGTYHKQGEALIAMQTYIYIGPATVSFSNIQVEEVSTNASASGAWQCEQGQSHDANPQPLTLSNYVEAYGTAVNAVDTDSSGACSGTQIQVSAESVTIPVQWSATGTFPGQTVGSVTQTATENANGNLSLTKSQASVGNISVSSPTNTPFNLQ